ncbi:MAG TPA: phosphopantetheine-binding protein [Rhodocyclaceae bacterium]|nr:phosphopantetheine-binding protein [Rhodocyclaceae bacterium]
MDILTTIRAFLAERTDLQPENITPEANLKELGIDSLMLLELIFECEEKLGLKIEEDTLTPNTIGDLIAIVEQAANGVEPA